MDLRSVQFGVERVFKMGVQNEEPEWILDKSESGPLIWRRDSKDARVTFRYDVEVKEFHRTPYEMEDYSDESRDVIGMSLTSIICIAITLILPLYVLTGKY